MPARQVAVESIEAAQNDLPMVQNSTDSSANLSNSKLLGDSDGSLNLRVRGSSRDGQVLKIMRQKCLLGTAANCTLRIQAAGISPYHCLIMRGKNGMVIRRYNEDTRVNGVSIAQAVLEPGDILGIGSLEFEVLSDESIQNKKRSVLSSEFDTSHRQLRELQSDNQRIKNQLDRFRSRNKENRHKLIQWLRDSNHQLSQLKNSDSDETYQVTIEELQHKLACSDQLRQTSEAEIKQLTEKQDALCAELNQVQANLQQVQQDQINKAARIYDLRKNKNHLVKKLIQKARQLKQQIIGLIEKQNEEAEELNTLRQTIAQHQESLESNPTQTEKIGALQNQLDSSIAELEQNRKQQKEQRSLRNNRLRKIINQLRTNKNTSSKILNLSEQLTAKADYIRDLRKKKNRIIHELIDGLRNEKSERLNQEQHSTTEQQQETNLLKQQFEKSNAELVSAYQQIEELTTSIEDSENSLNQLKQQYSELKEARELSSQQAERNLQEIQSERDTLLQEAEKLSLQNTEVISELDAVKSESHQTIETLEQEVERLTSELNKFRSQNSTSTEDTTESQTNEEADEYQKESATTNVADVLAKFGYQAEDEEFESNEESFQQEMPTVEQKETEVEMASMISDSEDEETSITDYMTQLFNRVNSKTKQPVVAEESEAQDSVASQNLVEETELEDNHNDEPFYYIPSQQPAENYSDLQQLRELANQFSEDTVNHSIARNKLQQWKKLALSKAVVAITTMICGFCIHLYSTGFNSLHFLFACLGYLLATFWGLQALVVLKHIVTLQNRINKNENLNDESIEMQPNIIQVDSEELSAETIDNSEQEKFD